MHIQMERKGRSPWLLYYLISLLANLTVVGSKCHRSVAASILDHDNGMQEWAHRPSDGDAPRGAVPAAPVRAHGDCGRPGAQQRQGQVSGGAAAAGAATVAEARPAAQQPASAQRHRSEPTSHSFLFCQCLHLDCNKGHAASEQIGTLCWIRLRPTMTIKEQHGRARVSQQKASYVLYILVPRVDSK